jgi:hypothetical protein
VNTTITEQTLAPVRRLTDAEIEERRATFKPVHRYIPKDPYRPLRRGERLVNLYLPSFVQGCRPAEQDAA